MHARVKSALKYMLALCLLALILSHAETDKIWHSMRQMSLLGLVISFIFVSAAMVLSAFRTRYFVAKNGTLLGKKYSIILFYVGAFYNFLLPGGIGGDAYKVVVLRHRIAMPAKLGIRVLLADRASGLCVLMLTLIGCLEPLHLTLFAPYTDVLLLLAAIIVIAGYIICCKMLLKQSARTMLWSLPYSIVGQGLWIAVIGILWASFATMQSLLPYIVLYSAASITAMLPISVGGLGIKEMTFYYGAKMITEYGGGPVDPDMGIALSLSLFALIFISSLPGFVWLHKVSKMPHDL